MKGLKVIAWILALSMMIGCACFVSFAAESGASGGGNVFIHILIALAVGFIVAFIVTGVMKSKLRSVHRQDAASNYTREGSFEVTESKEIYLYKKVDKTAKPKDKDD